MAKAARRLASVFLLPSVMSLSASLCASFALCQEVDIDSCLNSDVTRFRRRACRCDDERPRCRYLVNPPAMVVCGVESQGGSFGAV